MVQIKSSRIELADVLRGVAILGVALLRTMEHYNFYRFPEVGRFVQFASTAAWDGTFSPDRPVHILPLVALNPPTRTNGMAMEKSNLDQ